MKEEPLGDLSKRHVFFSAAILCFNQLSFKNNAATSFRSEKIYLFTPIVGNKILNMYIKFIPYISRDNDFEYVRGKMGSGKVSKK